MFFSMCCRGREELYIIFVLFNVCVCVCVCLPACLRACALACVKENLAPRLPKNAFNWYSALNGGLNCNPQYLHQMPLCLYWHLHTYRHLPDYPKRDDCELLRDGMDGYSRWGWMSLFCNISCVCKMEVWVWLHELVGSSSFIIGECDSSDFVYSWWVRRTMQVLSLAAHCNVNAEGTRQSQFETE